MKLVTGLITVGEIPNLLSPWLRHRDSINPVEVRLKRQSFFSQSEKMYAIPKPKVRYEPIPFKEWVKTHEDYDAYREEKGE